MNELMNSRQHHFVEQSLETLFCLLEAERSMRYGETIVANDLIEHAKLHLIQSMKSREFRGQQSFRSFGVETFLGWRQPNADTYNYIIRKRRMKEEDGEW